VDLNFYTFRSDWEVSHEPPDAYRALEAIEDYPSWWREVRSVRQISEDEYELTIRALLPYKLRFTGTIARQDRDAGVLEIGMRGDLEGFSRWTIRRSGAGSHLTFEEEARANKPLLRRLAPIARPLFRANHTVMMHNCRRGLSAYLAGLRRGRE